VRQGDVKVSKIPGERNPADLLTKNVPAELLSRHLDTLGCETLKDRAATAPRLCSLKDIEYEEEDDDNKTENWKEVEGGILRLHRGWRQETFTPCGVPGGPKPSSLSACRRTSGVYDNGEQFVIDDLWTNRHEAHKQLERPWMGATRFWLKRP
jgi:hypothetical protein